MALPPRGRPPDTADFFDMALNSHFELLHAARLAVADAANSVDLPGVASWAKGAVVPSARNTEGTYRDRAALSLFELADAPACQHVWRRRQT
jgi:hypothetical protein